MEPIYAFLLISILSCLGVISYLINLRIGAIEESTDRIFLSEMRREESYLCHTRNLLENIEEMDQKLIELSNQIDRFMVEVRETLESTKPIKSNNWDSIREAFKGPSRITVNERD